MNTLDQSMTSACEPLDAAGQTQINGGMDAVSFAKLPITFPRPFPPVGGPIKLPPIIIDPLPVPFPYDPVMAY